MTQVVIDIVQDVEKMLLVESQGWIFDLCINLGRISTIKDQTTVEREICRTLLITSEKIIECFLRAEIARFLGEYFNKINYHGQKALNCLRTFRVTMGPTNPLLSDSQGNISRHLLYSALDILSCRDHFIGNLQSLNGKDSDIKTAVICEFLDDILNVLPFYKIQEGYVEEIVETHIMEMRHSIVNKQGEIMGIKEVSP